MKKEHALDTIVCDGIAVQYFYTREKNDVNGNPRYRVYIIDPDAPRVYETIFKCYRSELPERVKRFIEEDTNNE